MMHPPGGFREAKNVSVGVLLDLNPVVHLVDAQNLLVPAVAAQLVILAHDQRLDRLCWTDLRAQPAETAPGQVEIEVVEDLDLQTRFAVPAERDQVVGTRLGTLVAHDAGLRAGTGLDLQAEDAAEPGRCRPSFRILSWSRIRPYSSASGRGGQPDT